MKTPEQKWLESLEIGEDFIINNIDLIDVGEPKFCKLEAINFKSEKIAVYGFKMGNWALLPDGDNWLLYHLTECKFVIFLPFSLSFGLKGLKILAALFGSEFTTPPMGTEAYAKAYRRAHKFERYCEDELVRPSYFYEDEPENDDDDDYLDAVEALTGTDERFNELMGQG